VDHLASPRLDDFVVILSPDGEELQKFPLLDAVEQSDYRQLLWEISSYALADPLHTNSVHVITEEEASRFAFGSAGQLLVSFREPSAIGVIDMDQGKLVWAAKGYWTGQHDPHILENGNILMFDNRGNFRKPEGRSRVIEFNPTTMELVWEYTGTVDSPLESDIRSYSQRLANGNTLITESNGGRILEVNPDREIVWEYTNPVRGGPDTGRIPIICKALRLEPQVAAAFLHASLET
jgi:outer membrane protein assembly factor BamB